MEGRAATCARCGSSVPLDVAACPTCGLPRTTPEADTKRRVTGDGVTLDDTVEGRALDGERSEDSRFQAGQKILGHYVVVRQLGKGGMGTVYLAKDEVSGQEVAVKVLPASLARERDIRERFVQEARALATMDHPNIVPLITFSQEDEDRFLVMKYIPGEPLDARIRRLGVLPPDEARTILRALLAALGFAHARGVIHRDVKPSNLIIEGDLTAQHRIFLVDFGIAKKEESTDKLTQTGMLMGTPQYMSPEQISGHVVDGRSDLYAAGLVMFEMLCGRPPFDGQKTFQVLRAHVEQPVPDMAEARGSALPDEIVALTQLLLAKDPDDRPADATAAIALLDGTAAFPSRPPTSSASAPTPATTRMPRPSFPPAQTAATFSQVAIRSDAELEDPSMDEIRALGRRTRTPLFAALFIGAAAIGAAFVLTRDGIIEDPFALAPSDAGDADLVDNDMKASLLISTGRMAFEKGDLENARIMADAALDLAPSDPSAHLLRAQVLLKGNAEQDAAAEVEKLRALTTLTPAEQQELTVLAAAIDTKLREQSEAADATEREKREREKRERDRGEPPSRLSNATLESITTVTTPTFQRCYEDEVLAKHRTAEGEVEISARVSPSGKVESVTLKVPAKLQRGAFVGCIREAALRWRFPKWQGKAESYRHKIHFKPS